MAEEMCASLLDVEPVESSEMKEFISKHLSISNSLVTFRDNARFDWPFLIVVANESF